MSLIVCEEVQKYGKRHATQHVTSVSWVCAGIKGQGVRVEMVIPVKCEGRDEREA